MNRFLYGFFTCFFLFTVGIIVQKGVSRPMQIHNTYATPKEIQEEFQNLYTAQFDVWTTTPPAQAIERAQPVVYYDGGTFVKFYTRLGNNRYSLKWTLDN